MFLLIHKSLWPINKVHFLCAVVTFLLFTSAAESSVSWWPWGAKDVEMWLHYIGMCGRCWLKKNNSFQKQSRVHGTYQKIVVYLKYCMLPWLIIIKRCNSGISELFEVLKILWSTVLTNIVYPTNICQYFIYDYCII